MFNIVLKFVTRKSKWILPEIRIGTYTSQTSVFDVYIIMVYYTYTDINLYKKNCRRHNIIIYDRYAW